MQVGLATDALNHDGAFQRACYGFAVFAIISPIIAVGSVVAVFVVMFFANWSRTVSSQHKRFTELGIEPLRAPGRGKVEGNVAAA